MKSTTTTHNFQPNGVLTLMTDFGTQDAYIGAMKGAVVRVTATLNILDITHQIPPQNIRHGAFVLKDVVPYFPAGTVHCCVVDPGVGTKREALIFQIQDQLVVAPDNGLISWLFNPETDFAWRIPAPDLQTISATFHGRDLFAPTAAALATGSLCLQDCALYVEKPVLLPNPSPEMTPEGHWVGEIISIDSFGNLITNLPGHLLQNATRIDIEGQKKAAPKVVSTYAEAEKGSLIALVGSGNLIEISLVDENASQKLEIGCGAEIQLLY